MRPDDSWNYGVIGDAAIELGCYDEAFAAFDRMASLKPTAAAYARIAYARSSGQLDGAVTAMRMAIEATSPQDPEGIAWAWSQLGALQLQKEGSTRHRRRTTGRCSRFRGIPTRWPGRRRVAAVRGDVDRALASYRAQLAQAPTPELAAQVGDLLHRRGDVAGASARGTRPSVWNATAGRTRRRSRRRLRVCWPSAIFSHRKRCAWRATAAQGRDDIFTNDALAWALYRTGAFEQAWAASERARRTGTRDRRILYHAAAIAAARGDTTTARTLAKRALDGHPEFDLIAAPAARRCWSPCGNALTAM